jgi:rubredoxin
MSSKVSRIMPEQRECPLCGTKMRLTRRDRTVRVPGNPKPTALAAAEWVCPDCDYFEEAEEERT